MAPDTGPAEATRPGVFRHHFRAFFAGSIFQITRLATGFVRIKYVALVLGTAGVGYLQPANQLQNLLISIASLSIGVGVINRMGAIGPGNPEGERRLLSTALSAQTAASLAIVLGAVLFSNALIVAVFGSDTLVHSPVSRLDILAVVFSVPLSVGASGYLETVFFGGGRYDLWVRASTWATVLGFLSTIAIIAVWRLPGAFWSIFVSSAMLLAAFIFHVRRIRPLSHLFRMGFDWPEANALARFSIAVLVSGALVPTAQLWVGGRVIAKFGIDARGLLAVPIALTSYYTPFLTNALWGRLHPTLTRVGPSPEGRHELTTALRLVVGLAAAAITAILFLKDLLVPLAYSRAFLPATRLLPMQLFGDYFYFVAFPFTVYALGISRLRVYLAAWVGYAVVTIVASLTLIPIFGVVGAPAGYAVSNLLGAVVAIAWLVSRRDDGLGTTLLMVAGGLVVVSAQSWLAWRNQLFVVQGAIAVVTGVVVLAAVWRARNASA
jgi:PST family polysaccharide transporter